MSDNLFDDIEVATVITGRSTLGSQIEEAWSLWVELTERPDRTRVNERFRSEYRKMLAKNFRHEDNLEIIRAAACMDPRPRDPQDVKRVIMPLTNYDHERAAKSLLKSGAPIILFPKPDTNVTRSDIRDLEKACETERSMWTEHDLAAAGILITDLDAKELKHVADRVALHIDSERILPTDMLRHYRAVGRDQLSAKPKASRSSYNAGRSEANTIKDVQFYADIAAERMMLQGVTPQEIVQFHNQAPEGYWDSVIEALSTNPSLTQKEVYESLEIQYQWKPSNRSK